MSAREPRVRRVPPADELAGDGELLVLVEDRAVRVAGLAPAILAATGSWREVDELTADLVAQYGAPPGGDAVTVVRTALGALEAAGLVQRERLE